MSWRTASGYCWSRAVRLLNERPGTTMLAVLLAGVALAVPVVAFMVAQSVSAVAGRVPGVEIAAFLAPGTGPGDTKSLATRAATLEGVANVRLITGEQAWAELQRRYKDTYKVPEARTSALPDMLVVDFAPGTATRVVEAAANAVAKLPRVESVQADFAWYRKLEVLARAASQAGVAAGAVAALLLLAVVLGAVRLTAVAERDELRVLEQIGAEVDFMRRPFVYAGATVVGLASAVGLGIGAALPWFAGPQLAELGREFGLELALMPPAWPVAVAFLAAGVLLGGAAAYYFAGRSIRHALR